jgi:hypothetical protein
MEEIYPTVVIVVIGETAPFQYEVSLKDAANGDAQVANIRTGTFNSIEEVIACFEWGLNGLVEITSAMAAWHESTAAQFDDIGGA